MGQLNLPVLVDVSSDYPLIVISKTRRVLRRNKPMPANTPFYGRIAPVVPPGFIVAKRDVWGVRAFMPRWLRFCWLIGVALSFPIVNTAGHFFVREYGEPIGRLITSGIWVFLAALSYFVFWLFAQSFLQKRN
jgi:hypothetical protein